MFGVIVCLGAVVVLVRLKNLLNHLVSNSSLERLLGFYGDIVLNSEWSLNRSYVSRSKCFYGHMQR